MTFLKSIISKRLVRLLGLHIVVSLLLKLMVKYFNDSKATNVGATIAAIESLADQAKQLVVIAGGDAKGADLDALKPYLNDKVKALICFGKDAKALVSLTEKGHLTTNMHEAVQLAKAVK